MGSAQSKAETIVDTMISAGISVLSTVVSENSTVLTQDNIIDLSGDCKISWSIISQKTYASVDIKSVVTAVTDAKFDQDIALKVKQAAEAAAKGIGINAATSTAITNAVINITAAVKSSVSSTAKSIGSQSNGFICQDKAGTDHSIFEQKTFIKSLSSSITSSTLVSDAKQKAVEDITQEVKATATGFDPTALGAIIAVIVAIVVVVVLGGGFFGVNKVVSLLISPQFWFLTSLFGTAGGFIMALLRLVDGPIFPYKKDAEKRNAAILMVSLITSGIGVFGMIMTGSMIM